MRAKEVREVMTNSAARAEFNTRLRLEGAQVADQHRAANPPRSWDPADEWLILRETCRDDFWTFFLHAWGVLYGPHAEDWLSKREPIAMAMAEWFQAQVEAWEASRAAGEDKQRKIMVMVTREFGKTTMFTQAGLLWIHLRNPNASTYIGSANREDAIAIMKAIKPVIDGTDKHALFARMFGNWYNPDLTWTRDTIVHAARTTSTRKDPSFGVWGVDSGITGKHPDVLALDDPNNYEKMATDLKWLEVVNEHCASLQPALQADGLLMYVGTPYGDNDNLRAALKRDGIATLTGIPMADFAEGEGGRWHVLHIPGRTADGTPVCPRVWPEWRMADYEKEHNAKYAAQVLLRPELSEDVPLTREQVEDCYVAEADIPLNMLRYTMHLDTAWKDVGGKRRQGDESVIQIWGHMRDGSGDVVFVEGHSSATWRGEPFYEQVVALIQKYKRLGRRILLVTDEISPGKKGANQMLLQSFCNAVGIPAPAMVELSRAGQNKFSARIVPAATYWQDGHVKIIRGAPGAKQLVDQMSRLTPEMAHDDWADAAADVFHPLVYQRMRLQKPHERAVNMANPTDSILRPAIQFYEPEDDYARPPI